MHMLRSAALCRCKSFTAFPLYTITFSKSSYLSVLSRMASRQSFRHFPTTTMSCVPVLFRHSLFPPLHGVPPQRSVSRTCQLPFSVDICWPGTIHS